MHVLWVLLWKHAIVRKRRIYASLFEFISPSVCLLLFFVIEQYAKNKSSHNIFLKEDFPLDEERKRAHWDVERIFYLPLTNLSDKLMKSVSEKNFHPYRGKLKFPLENVGMWSVRNELQLKTVLHHSDGRKLSIVEFHNLDGKNWPNKLEYTVRENQTFYTHSIKSKKDRNLTHTEYGYLYRDFIALQWAIDTEYIKLKSNKTVPQLLFYQHFPKPIIQLKDKEARLKSTKKVSYFLFNLFAWVGLIPLLVIQSLRFSKEKYSGLLQLNIASGVPMYYVIIAHVLNVFPSLILYTIFIVLAALAFPAEYILPVTLIYVLSYFWMFFLTYLCSCLFDKPKVVASFSSLLFASLPSISEAVNKQFTWEEHNFMYFLTEFLPLNPAFRLFTSMVNHESTIPHIVVMALQVLIIFLIAQFIQAVRPGKYGVRKPWTDIFLCFKSKTAADQNIEMESITTDNRNTYFEKSNSKLYDVGIEIKNVSKTFERGQSKKNALNNVNFNIYFGEITVLLGRNGAGKSTLMKIITGMFGATTGKVLVGGVEVASNRSSLGKKIGFCPQEKLLYKDVTIREHFRFFGMIRGARFEEAAMFADELLRMLKLTNKANSLCKHMSGGTLRRVQLGCALAGDPPVLVMDEPTSGLDVGTRRELWKLLLSYRGTRTVLLTTHFMEEADALGDRVAALHAGQLRCHATPMFLKRAIGSGYRLTLSLQEGYDASALTHIVTTTVEEAQVRETSLREMLFSLPAAETQQFPQLFDQLEQQKQQLGIQTMAVGITTLEEVFLRLCRDKSDDKGLPIDNLNETTYQRVTGWRLQMVHFKALFIRQFKFFTNRSVAAFFIDIVFPIVISFHSSYHMNGKMKVTRMDPPLKLNLHVYDELSAAKIFYNIRINNSERLLKPFKEEFPGMVFVRSDNVAKSILKEGNSDIASYDRMLIGLELNDTEANVLYTTKVRHALPVGVNMLTNLLAIQHNSGASGPDPSIITTFNHPVSNIINEKKTTHQDNEMYMYTFVIFIIFVAGSILSPIVSVAIFERLNGTRHIRLMTGVSVYMYYAVMACFHMTLYLILIIPTFVMSVLLLDTEDTLNNWSYIIAGIVLLVLNGLSFTAMCYILSFFTTESTASSIAILITIIFGMVLQIIRGAVKEKFFKILWALVPAYNFSYGMLKIAYVTKMNSLCKLNWNKCPNLITPLEPHFDGKACCASEDAKENGYLKYFALNYEHGAGVELILLSIQTVLSWVGVIILEKGIANKCWDKLCNRNYVPHKKRYKDSHVITEEKYVNTVVNREGGRATLDADTALVSNVHKRYYSCCKKYLAVKGVSFSVKKGECLGLLGVNGAGKSSIFKVLTGTEHPSRGEIYANGLNSKTQNQKFLTALTYCPQFGGLDDFLTGWDNVKLMCQLRGVPESHLKEEVKRWIQYVDLGRESKRLVRDYSAGFNRRCVTAACLAGAAGAGGRVLALLDEPTASVDPAARRKVWLALRQSQRLGLSIIITSHSMDEAEALCNRIAIMSAGEVGALGSASQLIEEYGSGYTVYLKLTPEVATSDTSIEALGSVEESSSSESPESSFWSESTLSPPRPPPRLHYGKRLQKIEESIKSTFQKARLEDVNVSSIQYHIEDDISYSEMFQRIENLKAQLSDIIEDYTISGTTLEEVFLKFARS